MTTDITASKINTALRGYSDKDWNYSRILLIPKPLADILGPYALCFEQITTKEKSSMAELKSVADEVKWGDHHSNELGILELISLRINKALFDSTSDEFWDFKRPVVRLVKKETLAEKGITSAFWYEVLEVAGDDFENR